MRPLNGRILVEQEAAPERVGSVVLPESAREKQRSTKGVVVALSDSPGGSLKVGDRVVFASYIGARVRVEDRELLLIEEADILAVEE